MFRSLTYLGIIVACAANILPPHVNIVPESARCPENCENPHPTTWTTLAHDEYAVSGTSSQVILLTANVNITKTDDLQFSCNYWTDNYRDFNMYYALASGFIAMNLTNNGYGSLALTISHTPVGEFTFSLYVIGSGNGSSSIIVGNFDMSYEPYYFSPMFIGLSVTGCLLVIVGSLAIYLACRNRYYRRRYEQYITEDSYDEHY